MTDDYRVYVGNGTYSFKIKDPIYEAASLSSEYVTRKQLALDTDIPVGTWKRWASEGIGPKPLTYKSPREWGAYPALYNEQEVEDFICSEQFDQMLKHKKRDEVEAIRRGVKRQKLFRAQDEVRALEKNLLDLRRKINGRSNRYR